MLEEDQFNRTQKSYNSQLHMASVIQRKGKELRKAQKEASERLSAQRDSFQKTCSDLQRTRTDLVNKLDEKYYKQMDRKLHRR